MGNNNQYPPLPSLIRDGATHVVQPNNLYSPCLPDETATFLPSLEGRGKNASPFTETNLTSYRLKKCAFTLAEVLITLGIIGVVAAMTMPVLIQKHTEKITVSRLKKVYSVLSQAYLYAVQENGMPEEWGIEGRDTGDTDEDNAQYNAVNAILIKNKLFSHLSVISDCENAKDKKACGFADEYYYMNGGKDTGLSGQHATTAAVTLGDGCAIAITANGTNGNAENRGEGRLQKTFALIYVDVNGIKPPNTWSKDVFGFYLTNDDITPMGTTLETAYNFNPDCYNSGLGCTAWVLLNENLDYLKCEGLDWSNTKCK